MEFKIDSYWVIIGVIVVICIVLMYYYLPSTEEEKEAEEPDTFKIAEVAKKDINKAKEMAGSSLELYNILQNQK